MLIENLNELNFLDTEDFIDFIVNYNCNLLGRSLNKKTYKPNNSILTLEYEDNLYIIKVNLHYGVHRVPASYTASATRKDINYTEELPYHCNPYKGEIYKKKWHETVKGFIADLKRIIYSIMNIDEQSKILGIVSKILLDENYGFLKTYNCSYVIFDFLEIPSHLHQMIQPGSILRFRQSTQCIKFKRMHYIKAIDFDNYIKHNTEIPLDELPGCASNPEDRDLVIKNIQIQVNGTEIIAPILYAFLEYKKSKEYCGDIYIGKWDFNSKILYLIDKNTEMIKLIARRREGFIYKYEWIPVYPKYPFKNITESDICFFEEMKKSLEKRGIDIAKVRAGMLDG